jgi:hypothetical protein
VPRHARQTVWLAPAIVLAFLAACRFDADYGGTALRCPTESSRCPDGFTCIAGVCTANAPDAATGPDATTCELAAQHDPNDVCGGARDLTTAALMPGGTVAYGTTTGYANDLTPSSLLDCTGQPELGADAIFRLTLAAGDDVALTLAPDGWTGDVYLIAGCSETAACEGGAAAFATANVTIATAGTYYVIVDAPVAGAGGCYALTATVSR